MRQAGRWLWRFGIALLVLVGAALAPVAYTELACLGDPVADEYDALLPPRHHRPESRTLLTYPEWHIVHAYEDYAQVIATSDPHDFAYLQAIGGFWSSLCALGTAAADHGGVPFETRQMVYTIGVSFSAEMLLKAAYEETLGRLAARLRGPERAPLDDLSARQAAGYARFLQQVPWYRWDFRTDAAALAAAATDRLRDRERRVALGLEYQAKAAYARLIARAVAAVGADAPRLRMVVTGAPPEALASYEGVRVIGPRGPGTEIETPRYRALTRLLQAMAADGIDFLEIAGNDDILLTAIGPRDAETAALHRFARQGRDDGRHLILVKVPDLAATLRRMPLTLEHVHDY